MSRRSAHATFVIAVVLALLVPTGALATFPGGNGLIAFAAHDGQGGSHIIAIAPDGSDEHVVTVGTEPSWSADGQQLAFEREGSIWVSAADGGGAREVLAAVSGDAGSTFHGAPAWAPQGFLVFFRITFRPDGSHEGGLWRVNPDGSEEVPLTSDGGGAPDVSPDGSTIAYAGVEDGLRAIILVGTDGSNRRAITEGVVEAESLGGGHLSPSWSPDGSQIAYVDSEGPRDGRIMVMNADGSGVRQLTDGPWDQSPAWSPDGATIAFSGFVGDASVGDGTTHLFLVNADGSEPRIISDVEAGGLSWQPQAGGAQPPPPSDEPFDLDVGDVKFDGDPATTERVDTPSPVAAALAIAQGRFATAADGGGPAVSVGEFAQDSRQAAHVVLSRDDVFADSLAGAPLVGDGPIFFTSTEQLHPQTRAELDRVLQPGGRVYVLGGVGAVSQAIEDELTAAGYEVVRLSGPSRVETSVRIGQEVLALYPGDQVAVARAGGPADNPTAAWADSITGGAWAAFAKVPVVVTPSEQLHPAIAEFLDDVQPTRTVLLGGTAALSPEVEAEVPNPTRVAGPSRDETAVEIAEVLWQQLASGERRYVMFNAFQADGWMFGLAAAGVAADAGAPLLPVNPSGPSEAVLGQVKSDSDGVPIVDLLLLGDNSVIPLEAQQELDAQD